MAFERGHRKFGGRKRGVKNKRLRAASEVFEKLAFNSLEKAIHLIDDENVEMQHRVGLLKEVMKYQFPQLRSVEHIGDRNNLKVIESRRNILVQIFQDKGSMKAIESIAERVAIDE